MHCMHHPFPLFIHVFHLSSAVLFSLFLNLYHYFNDSLFYADSCKSISPYCYQGLIRIFFAKYSWCISVVFRPSEQAPLMEVAMLRCHILYFSHKLTIPCLAGTQHGSFRTSYLSLALTRVTEFWRVHSRVSPLGDDRYLLFYTLMI